MPPPSSPCADADADADAVLDFLRRHGLRQAESALRAEILAGGGGGAAGDSLPTPVRVGAGSGGGVLSDPATASSSSSDGDEFVSFCSLSSLDNRPMTMSSSVSDLINPYGVWNSSRAESAASSLGGGSDFGTAREYDDSYWYNEKGGFPWSPLGVDKFVTSVGLEDLYDGPVEVLASGGFDYVKDISSLDTGRKDSLEGMKSMNVDLVFCDCCHKQKGFYPSKSTSHGIIDEVAVSSVSPYDSYDLSYTEPKSLDSPELTRFQLELENNVSEVISWKESTMHYSNQSTSSTKKQVFVPPVPELELQIFDSFAEGGISPLTGQFSNSRVNVTSTSYAGDQGKCGIQLRDYELMANGSSDLANDEETVEQPQISGLIADGGLEQETPTGLQVSETVDEAFEIFDLRIIHRKRRTGFEENKDIPIVLNTIIAGRYHLTEYLGSAAFSKVVQAYDLQTGVNVCLKIIKNDKDFFDQSLDEIKLLKFVNKNDPADEHHILRLYDYFYHHEHLFIVCELLRANLYEFQKYNHESGSELYFTLPRLQRIARQCLEALEYLHKLGVIHCDLKPENILIKSYSRCEIKVIDLGSSCFQSDNLCLYVQSRSYRAPEVILGLPYDQKIDIWSLGCILAELWSGDVLFPNESLVMVLARMISLLGPIDMEMLINGQETQKYFTSSYDLYHKNEVTDELEYIVPEKSSLARHLKISDAKFFGFLSDLLQTSPLKRSTASEALRHSWLSYTY